MKNILELSRIVTRNKLSKIEILDERGDEGSLYARFYNALTKENVTSDKEMARLLYDTLPGDDRYRQLKSRFSRRLMANLFLIDMNESAFSDYKKADYNAYRNYAICRILMRNSGTVNFERIAKKTFNLAREYEITQVAVLFAQELCDYYSFTGGVREFEFYSNELSELRPVLTAELEAQTIHQKIKLQYTLPTSAKRKAPLADLEAYAQRLIELRESRDSYGLHLTAFQGLWICYQLMEDNNRMREMAEQAEQVFLTRRKVRVAEHVGMAVHAQMESHLNLRDFKSGATTAKRAAQLFKKESQNWLLTQELHVHLALLAAQYQSAAEIFGQVASHPMFKNLPALRIERWRLVEAYLQYALHTSGIKSKGLPPFNPDVFATRLPEFSKDKAGYNAAIVIIQTMWLYELGKTGDIIDRADGLRMYNYRYLQKEKGKRAFLFIKMLLAATAVSFDPDRVAKKTESTYRELQSTRSNTVYEWEIIPYETLWERVLTLLPEFAL